MYPIQSRLAAITKRFIPWANATRNVRTLPLRTYYPENLEDLIAMVDDARENKITIRVVGAGHSFSDAAKEDNYIIVPLALKDCSIYAYALKDSLPKGRHLVKVQAGIRIKELNKKLHDMGCAVDNMGAFDWQTISGAISCGTHGSGLHRPAMPDMVRSIRMVLSDSKVWQIEPTNGITNAAQFDKEGIQLVQDDDVFNSCLISLGGMGIIYEYVLEVNDTYWIEETRKVVDWDDYLKPALLNGDFEKWMEKEYDFVSFRISPYYTTNKKSGKPQRLVSLDLQKIRNEEMKVKDSKPRNPLFTFLGNLRFAMDILIFRLNAKLSRIPQSIDMAIKNTSDRDYVNLSYKVLYQSGLSIRRQGISSEFAFDLDYKNLVTIQDKLAIHFAELRDKYDLYLSSHIPVRFVPKSSAFLSQCHTGPKMYIDLPTLEGVHGSEQILDRDQQFVLNELNGIIHWGKLNYSLYSRHDLIHKHYPQAKKWSEIRNRLDPLGMFHGYLIKKMGL